MIQNDTDIFTAAGKNNFAAKNTPKLQMAPMIDVIFLLLSFFILTAKFRKPEDFLSLKISHQNSSAATGIIEPLQLDIHQDGGNCLVKIADSPAVVIRSGQIEEGLQEFISNFRGTLEQLKRLPSDPVIINCDDAVQWDYLVKIYNIMHAMGVDNIEFDLSGQL